MSSATIDRVIQALHWRKAIAVELPAFHSATAHPPPIKNSLPLHSRYFRHYVRSFALDVHFYSVLCVCVEQVKSLSYSKTNDVIGRVRVITPRLSLSTLTVDESTRLSSFGVTLYSFTAHFYLFAFENQHFLHKFGFISKHSVRWQKQLQSKHSNCICGNCFWVNQPASSNLIIPWPCAFTLDGKLCAMERGMHLKLSLLSGALNWCECAPRTGGWMNGK